LGVNIDIIPPDTADLSPWRLVLAPGLFNLSAPLRTALRGFEGKAIFGPRANCKTPDFAIPPTLGPDLPGLDIRVVRVESLPPGTQVGLESGAFVHWAEDLEGQADVTLRRTDGTAAMVRAGSVQYLAGWPDDATLRDLMRDACAEMSIATIDLPDGVRTRDCGGVRFWFNHGPDAIDWQGEHLPAAGVRMVR
jgi:beta-galactosidase